MKKYIGILTAGGDCPGLNAAIRGVGKAALSDLDMQIIGFRDGFRGVLENRTMPLDSDTLAGILTVGGTILGTSRDKPHRMPMGDKVLDMTDAIVQTCEKHHVDVLVCVGGGGTQKNAFRLMQAGLPVITLPKTIDNDIAMTDTTMGFDTALSIATESIDRLHSTAHSHHRIIVVEIMGHNSGWLALGSGIAGGADVILIPEIPYDIHNVAKAIKDRGRSGKRFSIVAVAEGAHSKDDAVQLEQARAVAEQAKKKAAKKNADAEVTEIQTRLSGNTLRLAQQLEELTGLEARVTILGYLQRGGTPSAADRLLASRLGTACATAINAGQTGVMMAVQGERIETVALEQVVGKKKMVPLDHSWIETARLVGTTLGD